MSNENWRQDLHKLQSEVSTLRQRRFIRMYDSTTKLLWFNFLRGLAFGLGSVIGATLLVSLVVFMLKEIDFIPIIGDWAAQILDIISTQVDTQQ